MRTLSEYNPKVVGAVGIALVGLGVGAALNYDRLPLLRHGHSYSAYLSEAGGLTAGSPVQVAGLDVGKVTDLRLDNARVRVDFTVEDGIRLGERTEAAVKTKTLLGARILAVEPRGDGTLRGPIPLDRTSPAYELPQALGDISSAISGLDTAQLNDSLTTLAAAFGDTPDQLKAAVSGVTRLSAAVANRDGELRDLLANANGATGVLAQRADQLVTLAGNSNNFLAQLRTQSSALQDISVHVSALAEQVSGFVGDNRDTLKPALEKLNGVLAILDKNKENLQKSIKLFDSFTLSLGEAVSGGPFFNAYVVNLVPGQFMQPFIDAAFSDLGLDPNVLLPSQLTDPQVGQKATPPMPVPYPRTGQGGEPRLSVPDAITGNPGDDRYPYRPPLPQPAPGGPPPGPPAGYDPNAPAEILTAPTETDGPPAPVVPPLPGVTP